jgi:hypothetical protein
MGQCYHSIVVDAPVSEVWATIRNFHDLSWAAGVIDDVEIVGDKGPTEVGAQRILNGAFHETLLDLDDDGPGPLANDAVKSYRGCANVYPITATDQTFVIWTSEYEAKDGTAVGELCDPVYHALLAALATHFAH